MSFYRISLLSLHIQMKLILKTWFTSKVVDFPQHLSGSQTTGDKKAIQGKALYLGCLWVYLSHMLQKHCESELAKLLRVIITFVHLCWLNPERHSCLQKAQLFICVCTYVCVCRGSFQRSLACKLQVYINYPLSYNMHMHLHLQCQYLI